MIVITADVGGTKTSVAITNGEERLSQVIGPGAAVRPGRALASATIVAGLMRSALAQTKLLRADAVVIGAAGAGRATDAEEMRIAVARERIADRVVVVSDVALALEALGLDVAVVLVAGTGSVAIGRAPGGTPVRQGGYGWQMGDEGGGYWIGQQALRAAGLAHDGRGPATTLLTALMQATGVGALRDLVGWSTIASAREVATLSRGVVSAAASGDAVAAGILDQAAAALAQLVNQLAEKFGSASAVPVGFTGGLVGPDGPLQHRVTGLIDAPFVPRAAPLDPLLGGPRLARQDGERNPIRL